MKIEPISLPSKYLRPRDMDRIPISNEMKRGLSGVAISIFTDCVNGGSSFQDALLAIYLSGLHQKEVKVWAANEENAAAIKEFARSLNETENRK